MRGILAIVIALVAMAPLVYAIDVSMSCDSGGCVLPIPPIPTRYPPFPSSIVAGDNGSISPSIAACMPMDDKADAERILRMLNRSGVTIYDLRF